MFLSSFFKKIILHIKSYFLQFRLIGNKNTRPKLVSGFSMLELFIVLAIITLLCGIVIATFIDFRKNQALSKDTETIVEVLNQARNQTISSKNQSAYGVHFASSVVTLFTGGTYSAGASDNQNFSLNSADTVLTISLTGGGSNVVFTRISGETTQNGTITVSS